LTKVLLIEKSAKCGQFPGRRGGSCAPVKNARKRDRKNKTAP